MVKYKWKALDLGLLTEFAELLFVGTVCCFNLQPLFFVVLLKTSVVILDRLETDGRCIRAGARMGGQACRRAGGV